MLLARSKRFKEKARRAAVRKERSTMLNAIVNIAEVKIAAVITKKSPEIFTPASTVHPVLRAPPKATQPL